MSKEAMKLALEALEDENSLSKMKTARAILREALSKQEQGEPVALYKVIPTFYVRDVNGVYIEDSPLNYYTTPQQRKPLTDEQIMDLWPFIVRRHETQAFIKFAKSIEAAHGIKE